MNSVVRLMLLLIFGLTVYDSFSQRLVTGRVLDNLSKEPIINATVRNNEKKLTTLTNHLGYFQLEVDSVDMLTVLNDGYEELKFLPPSSNSFQVYMIKNSVQIYKEGMQYFYDFIGQNIQYPINARTFNRQGTVYVSFNIDTSGKLTNLNVINDIGGGCGKEVKRVIKKIPSKFISDTTNSLYILPVKFVIRNMESKKMTQVNLPDCQLLIELVVTAVINNN